VVTQIINTQYLVVVFIPYLQICIMRALVYCMYLMVAYWDRSAFRQGKEASTAGGHGQALPSALDTGTVFFKYTYVI